MARKLVGAISAVLLASTLVHGAWAQSGSDQAHEGQAEMPGHMGGSGMSGGHGGEGPSGHGGMHHGMMQKGMMQKGMMQKGMMQKGMMRDGSPQGGGMHGMMRGMMHGGGMMGAPMGKLTSPYAAGVLGLSEEQMQRIEEIQRENAREHWSLKQEVHERHRAMMGLMREAAPDPQALAEAHDEASAAHRRLLVLQAELQREVLDVLSDEQRQRLQEMRSGSMHHR